MPTVYLNGEFIPAERAVVSVNDRGFLFGDGIYEVWRVVEGRLFERERHQARLEHGLRELQLGTPDEARPERLGELAARLLAENGLTGGQGTLYLEITRGAAPRTHHFPPAGTRPTVYAFARRFVPPEEQRRDGVAAITAPDVRWSRCDVKTVQLLPNVLASEQAHARGALEALFIRDGVLTEGTHANAFVVLDGVLRTHPRGPHILPGITRDVVLELARALGIAMREEPVTVDELARADELFVTGTTTDVTPVVRLDDRPVGSGAPGAIARRLYSALCERLAAAGRR